MKNHAWILTAFFAFSGAGAFTARAADCKAMSGKLLDNLDHGNYAAASSDFDDKMKTLSPEQLQQNWEGLTKKLGARGARDAPKVVQKDGKNIVLTPVHYALRTVNAVVVCSPDGQIAEIHVMLPR